MKHKALGVGIIIFVAVIAMSYFLLNSPDDSIVITGKAYEVYGESILKADVEESYDKLPDTLKENITETDVATALATQKLLVKEAVKEEIVVTDEEVDEFIAESIELSQMSNGDYYQKLKNYDLTEDEYKEQVKEQMLIAKLINDSIDPDDYAVSDKEIDDFIEENKEAYDELLDDELFVDVLRARLGAQMKAAKQQDLLEDYIENLKS